MSPDAELARAFGWYLPTRVRFGPGVRAEAGAAAASLGGRVALMHGRSFGANPGAAALTNALGATKGLEIVADIEAHGEPDDESVRATADTLRGHAPSVRGGTSRRRRCA